MLNSTFQDAIGIQQPDSHCHLGRLQEGLNSGWTTYCCLKLLTQVFRSFFIARNSYFYGARYPIYSYYTRQKEMKHKHWSNQTLWMTEGSDRTCSSVKTKSPPLNLFVLTCPVDVSRSRETCMECPTPVRSIFQPPRGRYHSPQKIFFGGGHRYTRWVF